MKIKKRTRIVFIIVGAIILVFIGYRVWHRMDDKYAIVEYALDGTSYKLDDILCNDEYICYRIIGSTNYKKDYENDYENVLEKFEDFIRLRPESYLNGKKIEINFSDEFNFSDLKVFNYLPDLYKMVSEHHGEWYCSASECHDKFDTVFIWDDFDAHQICNLGVNTDNNITYLKICDDKADGAYLAKVFPNVHYILVNYDEFNEEKVLKSNKAIADFMAINDTCVFCNYSRKEEKWICPAE